jgi:hypothetical protein
VLSALHEPPIGDRKRLVSQHSISMPLHVLHAVRDVAPRDRETPAPVAHRLHDGQVRLYSDLAGAMMHQSPTMVPATYGPKLS